MDLGGRRAATRKLYLTYAFVCIRRAVVPGPKTGDFAKDEFPQLPHLDTRVSTGRRLRAAARPSV
jgi:hypothetical protein